MITKDVCARLTWRQEVYMCSFRDRVVKVRVNGALKTWKTEPERFRLPVKYGLRECGAIDQDNCDRFFITKEEAEAALEASRL